MTKLEEISTEELYAALEEVEYKKPTQRLMLAILYKQGPSVPMIASWFNLRERLLYRWFSEMEEKPLIEAVQDRSPPGRPSKLTEEQRKQLAHAVSESPRERGYDSQEWTPETAQKHIADEFDVEYTPRHVQRLLNDIETLQEE